MRRKKEVNKVNVRKLRAKMIENNFSVEALSNIIGVSKSTFYRKLTEKGENFTIGEANAIARALNAVVTITPKGVTIRARKESA